MKWLALLTPIVLTGAFFVLAAFSTGKYHPDAKLKRVEASYDAAEIAAINALATHTPTLRERQAAVLKQVYGLTEENMNAHEGWWR